MQMIPSFFKLIKQTFTLGAETICEGPGAYFALEVN